MVEQSRIGVWQGNGRESKEKGKSYKYISHRYIPLPTPTLACQEYAAHPSSCSPARLVSPPKIVSPTPNLACQGHHLVSCSPPSRPTVPSPHPSWQIRPCSRAIVRPLGAEGHPPIGEGADTYFPLHIFRRIFPDHIFRRISPTHAL